MSRFEDLVTRGTRVLVTAELPTIDGGDLETVRRHLQPLLPWVDAVNATDNTAAHAHASNVAIAIAIKQLGGEPIMQVVCRDRNRLAIEADIVGASLHGVDNICCLTGDDVTAGDEPESRRVFDLDGPQLIRVATRLSRGYYLSGRPLGSPPSLFVGAVENPAAPPLGYRVRRALTKAAAGARFLQLQLCYHPERLEAFATEAWRTGLSHQVALLQTVCLTRGARALRFMDAKVPGISIPPATIERVERAADSASAAFDLTREQARHALAQPGIRGLHIVDFRRDGSLARLASELGVGPGIEERHAHGTAIPV